MKKKISVSVALCITLLAMALTVSITMVLAMRIFDNTMRSTLQRQAQYSKMAEIDRFVRDNFYGTIDDARLSDAMGAGYMAGLGDPYSVYYTASEVRELEDIASGKLVGIGIEVVRNSDGRFRIVKVYDGSPASTAQVRRNQLIDTINGVDTRTISNEKQMMAALRGAEGTTVELVCLSGNQQATYKIQRIPYTEPNVEAVASAEGYPYIRIIRFGKNAAADFDYALGTVQTTGSKALIIDVRDASGGDWQEAYTIIDQLCPLGVIATMEGRDGVITSLATSSESGVAIPIVVLINGKTAGPGELLAASVREMAHGQLVGTRTAGRGTIQSPLQRLSDGSAITVTIGRVLTNSGTSFNETGLTPDIDVAAVENQVSINEADFTSDPQILRGFEIARNMARAAGTETGGAVQPAPASEAPSDSSGSDASGSDDSSGGEGDE